MGKWQDDECIYLKSHVERGEWFEIEDFGENYHIERKREHQSYYFSEIGVSLHGNMLRICVEDLSDEYLGPGQFPPSPLYTHIYIGPFPFPLSLPLIKVTMEACPPSLSHRCLHTRPRIPSLPHSQFGL